MLFPMREVLVLLCKVMMVVPAAALMQLTIDLEEAAAEPVLSVQPVVIQLVVLVA